MSDDDHPFDDHPRRPGLRPGAQPPPPPPNQRAYSLPPPAQQQAYSLPPPDRLPPPGSPPSPDRRSARPTQPVAPDQSAVAPMPVAPMPAGGSSRLLTTAVAAIGLLVVVLVAVAVAALFIGDDEAVASTITEGDCFADFAAFEAQPEGEAVVGPVESVDCATAHALETYYVGAAYAGLGDDYPAFDVLDDVAITECEKRFENFVATDWETSELDFWWLTPSDDSWERGDRGLVCLVGDSARELTTGSLVDAGR